MDFSGILPDNKKENTQSQSETEEKTTGDEEMEFEKEVDQILINWLKKDDKNIHIFKDPLFHSFINKLNPLYSLPILDESSDIIEETKDEKRIKEEQIKKEYFGEGEEFKCKLCNREFSNTNPFINLKKHLFSLHNINLY